MVRVRGVAGHANPAGSEGQGLADRLRERTRSAHEQAERTGIVRDLFRGRASRRGYALYLRNLLPAYAALERAIEHRRTEPWIAPLAIPAVYRAPAIEVDLAQLEGDAWRRSLPLLPEGAAYADRIETTGAQEPARLIAHAYTRYLGDLNGGQVLKSLLARTLGLTAADLSFHEFAAGGDLPGLRRSVRDAIDRAGRAASDVAAILEEGEHAFRCNIAVSIAAGAAAPASPY